MREVLIATTFREFDGGVNARIQELFIDSIARQTYTNFRFVVTNFGEQTVRGFFAGRGVPYVVEQGRSDCRFSFGDTVSSTFRHLEKGKHIVLWTNADNVYPENFLETVVTRFTPAVAGTSFPHRTFNSLEDFHAGAMTDPYFGNPVKSIHDLDPNVFVPDLIYLDGDLLLDPRVQSAWVEHRIRDEYPGVAQSLMLGMLARRRENLCFVAPVATIANSRPTSPVLPKMVGKNPNEARVRAYCAAVGVPSGYFVGRPWVSRKFLQNASYRPVGDRHQRAAFRRYLAYYAIRPRRGWVLFSSSWQWAKRRLLARLAA